MKKFNHFNHISSLYDGVFGQNVQTDILAGLLDLPDQGRFLDAAGGTGRISCHLSKGNLQVFLTDSAFKMLVEAKKKSLRNLIHSEIEFLSFTKESFERIIMVDALHHMTDQIKVLDEIWRVLKPEGIFLIEEPDITHFSVKMLNLAEKVFRNEKPLFISKEIASHYEEKAAKVNIYSENHTAWIVITKPGRINK